MDRNSIIAQIKAKEAARAGIKLPEPVEEIVAPAAVKPKIEIPINVLPALQDGQFLLEFDLDDKRAVACVRELSWHEVLLVDMEAYVRDRSGVEYYDGVKEQSITLKKAVFWVYIAPDDSVVHNVSDDFLSQFDFEAINKLWDVYSSATSVTAEEANRLITASRTFFSNSGQDSPPIPPIVLMADFLAQGWLKYSEQELIDMPASKMERLKLILSVRADVLSSPKSSAPKETPVEANVSVVDSQGRPLDPNDRMSAMKFIGMRPRGT